jgi:uncharacterized protein YndB with AHSA1/START domain
MNTRLRVALSIVPLLVIGGAVVYAVGASLPVDHSVWVTGTVNAPPSTVFARITDVAHATSWRPQVKSIQLLPRDNDRDAWIEDYGHGQTMKFVATFTTPPRQRVVELDDPNAQYGGTWTYDLSTGPSPNTTTLKITETGYVKPPLYRFMMVHIIGPTKNLDDYLKDIQAAYK